MSHWKGLPLVGEENLVRQQIYTNPFSKHVGYVLMVNPVSVDWNGEAKVLKTPYIEEMNSSQAGRWVCTRGFQETPDGSYTSWMTQPGKRAGFIVEILGRDKLHGFVNEKNLARLWIFTDTPGHLALAESFHRAALADLEKGSDPRAVMMGVAALARQAGLAISDVE
jgi:hypothetical protein